MFSAQTIQLMGVEESHKVVRQQGAVFTTKGS